MTSIEIGGGTLVQPGWVNLDPTHGKGEWQRPAQAVPWPTADNSVAAIRASHVMEHIPAGADRIAVMNEAHRVLKPGGMFEIRVPNALSGTWHAFADPTHVSFWCIPSFHYFDGSFAANADYGIQYWTTHELLIQGDNEILWRGSPR
jgi:predicted SAM-dependent methyltransferase